MSSDEKLENSQSVLLLLAKCCIRAGVSASDAQALDEALECLDLVIEIGTDIEIGKFLRLKTLVLLQRYTIIEPTFHFNIFFEYPWAATDGTLLKTSLKMRFAIPVLKSRIQKLRSGWNMSRWWLRVNGGNLQILSFAKSRTLRQGAAPLLNDQAGRMLSSHGHSPLQRE
jgi:hypothetical protein